MELCYRLWLTIICCIGLSSCADDDTYKVTGTLERDRIVLTAPAAEVIVNLPVREGSEVQEGTILVQLNAEKQRAILEQAQAKLVQSRHQLEKLQHGERDEDIAVAQANVEEVQAALNEKQKRVTRLKTLAAQSLSSRADLDAAIASRDTTQASLEAAHAQLNKVSSGFRHEDIELAQDAVAAATAQAALESKRLDELTIVATRNGILDSLPFNLGERVSMNDPVAVLLAENPPYARVYVPEPIKSHFSVGMNVQVFVDGIENSLDGKVRWLAVDPAFTPYTSMSEDDRSRFVYLAEIELSDAAASIPGGIPVQVTWNKR